MVPMDETRRNRWFQFSLRAMFIAVVVCAVVASVGPPIANRLFPPELRNQPAIIVPQLQLWNPRIPPEIQRLKDANERKKPIPIYDNPYREPQAETLS